MVFASFFGTFWKYLIQGRIEANLKKTKVILNDVV